MKNKKKIWSRICIGLLVVIVLIIGGIAWTIHSNLSKVEKVEIDKENLSINKEDLAKYENSEEIINIALFGVDTVEGESGRTDSIMILTLDTVHKKIKLTSIMRDSYVNIEGYGMDKINHAYAYGKAQLSLKTINQNYGLDVDKYALVNFNSLSKIVDILGGVELEITDEEVAHINGIDSAGVYTLNGAQALAYSRIRYASGGDYVRTERQRNVINALFNKGITMPATSYLSILNEVLPYIQTNMSATEIISLATNTLGLITNPTIEQARLPLDGYSEGSTINGIYYLTFDREYTKEKFMNYIFNDISME